MEMTSKFESLPDNSQLWIFPLQGRPEALQQIPAEAADVIEDWKSHGACVDGAYIMRYGFFLLVASAPNSASGCSIDSLFRHIKERCTRHDVEVLDNSNVFYLSNGNVTFKSRAEFAELALNSGEINGDTTVFDGSIHTLGELRAGKWEKRFAESWHAKAFPLR